MRIKIAVIALAVASPIVLANDADRVLVIRNANSAVSRSIADDYVRRRGVRHVLTIACKDSSRPGNETPHPEPVLRPFPVETIGLAAYLKDVERPIRAYLEHHPGIDFIVLTKGIPLRIEGAGEANGIDRFSLDSRLAALGYEKRPDSVRVDIVTLDPKTGKPARFPGGKEFHGVAWANRFWNSSERFSHSRFAGYLVTRLDGYTEADAKALTARSLSAEQSLRLGKTPEGKILLDSAPAFGYVGKARQPYSILAGPRAAGEPVKIRGEDNYGNFNSDMQLAAELLNARGVPVDFRMNGPFAGHLAGLMGYVSWGSNDPQFDAAAYHSLTFAPGALCDTAVSTSARTFLPTEGGQSLIADLIAQGVTGVKGYTEEPLLQAIASPSILFDRYTRGWTLAEALYAASSLVGWEDVVIGDPIGRAYPQARE